MRIVFIESYRNICHFLLGIVEKIRIENFHSTFFTLTLARGRGSHPFSQLEPPFPSHIFTEKNLLLPTVAITITRKIIRFH